MEKKPNARIEAHFGGIEDPRNGNATQHKLIDIITIAILAIVCGADGWTERWRDGETETHTIRKQFLS